MGQDIRRTYFPAYGARPASLAINFYVKLTYGHVALPIFGYLISAFTRRITSGLFALGFFVFGLRRSPFAYVSREYRDD